MINVTDVFLNRIKEIIKEKGLSPLDYVICFVLGDIVDMEVGLKYLIVPIESFESDEVESQLPFKNFILAGWTRRRGDATRGTVPAPRAGTR